jgi:hypothetical protein
MSAQPSDYQLDCGCRFRLEQERERITRQCPKHERESEAAHRASSEERALARAREAA